MTFDAVTTLQYHVAHRHQLLRAGVAPSTISRRLRTGEWQRLLPAVYALFATECTVRHRIIAALLYAGADAQLAGRTALTLYGLRQVAPDDRVHLLVPHHRQLGPASFAVLHRTTRMPEPLAFREPGRTLRAQLPVSPPARAIADTARWGASATELRTVVAEALGQRLVTEAALRAELAGSQRNGTARLRVALAEVVGEAATPVENDLRASLLQSRVLPRIVWNPRLRAADGRELPAPEVWIPDVALGLQIDGVDVGGQEIDPAEPAASEAWERAEARRAVLSAHGALILRFPLTRLRRDPAGVRRALERAYLQRRGARVDPSIRVE